MRAMAAPEDLCDDCPSSRVGSVCYVTDRPVVAEAKGQAQHFTLGEMLSSPHPEIQRAAQARESVLFGGTLFLVTWRHS